MPPAVRSAWLQEHKRVCPRPGSPQAPQSQEGHVALPPSSALRKLTGTPGSALFHCLTKVSRFRADRDCPLICCFWGLEGLVSWVPQDCINQKRQFSAGHHHRNCEDSRLRHSSVFLWKKTSVLILEFSLRCRIQAGHTSRVYWAALREKRQEASIFPNSSASPQFTDPDQKGALYCTLILSLNFCNLTQGTCSDCLVWRSAGLMITVPQDCTYLATLKAAVWEFGFQLT